MNVKEESVVKAAADEPAANRYTPAAQDVIARLRAIATEIAVAPDPRPFTPAEIRLARSTSPASLEKAAVFAEAVPGLALAVPESGELRDSAAFELAFGVVRDEARALARAVDMEIIRRKLKAAKVTRTIYRIGQGYVTLDAGDSMKPHVADIRRTLVRRRRKSTDPAAKKQE